MEILQSTPNLNRNFPFPTIFPDGPEENRDNLAAYSVHRPSDRSELRIWCAAINCTASNQLDIDFMNVPNCTLLQVQAIPNFQLPVTVKHRQQDAFPLGNFSEKWSKTGQA